MKAATLLILAAGSALTLGACERDPAALPDSTARNTTPPPVTTPSTPPPTTVKRDPVPSTPATPPSAEPDNTRNNEGDEDEGSVTPIDQSNAPEDIRITADIRKAVLEDTTFSTNAKNCKIVTQAGGRVTLRGVVESQSEKDAIGALAEKVAGVASVDNQLEVNP